LFRRFGRLDGEAQLILALLHDAAISIGLGYADALHANHPGPSLT
jgi:hypothetical protein